MYVVLQDGPHVGTRYEVAGALRPIERSHPETETHWIIGVYVPTGKTEPFEKITKTRRGEKTQILEAHVYALDYIREVQKIGEFK